MGLFSKKECSICGGDAGRVFTKKLEDGILCKECTGKLSPWFSDRRSSTVAQIQEQLAYREANKAKVANFSVTRTLNGQYKILMDENQGLFMVTDERDWRNANPDVLSFGDVTGCTYEIKEERHEINPPQNNGPHDDPHGGPGGHGGPQGDSHGGPGGHGGPQGDSHGGPHGGPQGGPGGPGPRVEYSYDFYVTINVNHPYFTEIEYQLNENEVKTRDGAEYQSYVNQCEEIKAELTQVRETTRAAAAPKQATTCPHCGATTTPNAQNCCEYCGGAL